MFNVPGLGLVQLIKHDDLGKRLCWLSSWMIRVRFMESERAELLDSFQVSPSAKVRQQGEKGVDKEGHMV